MEISKKKYTGTTAAIVTIAVIICELVSNLVA